MKQKLLFLLTALMLLTTGNAWADVTVVGAEDNSDDKYYDESGHFKRYALAPGKQIKIEFTVSTATDEQLGETTWGPWFAWAVNFWDGTNNAITIEPRDYGWEDKTSNTRWTANWAKYWAQNYPSGWDSGTSFRDIIQNATVVMTMKRIDKQVIVIYDITTAGGQKYRQYAVKEYGGGNNTITFDLIVNHAHITIDNSKTVTSDTDAVTGTLIGNLNRCTTFTDAVNALRQNFIIAPDGSLSLRFKNYSAGVFTWQSWMFEMLYNGKYCNMVAANNNQWGELRNGAGTFTNTNWPTDILTQMEGATVDLTITRSGANVVVNAVHTPVSGDPFTLNYNFNSTEENFATSDAEFHLISDYGYLDLLPVSTSISSYGWATFSSDYALDFSKATEGLEAYMITGHEGNVVTKSKVTGTVPAGTGLLLKGAEGDYNIPIVGSSNTNVSANKLVAGTGVAISAEEGKTKYVLGVNGSEKAEFQKIVSDAATVPTGKAYLQFNEVISGARALIFDPDEVTSINVVEVTEPEAGALKDGKFLENGKIVIVKNGVKYSANGQILK